LIEDQPSADVRFARNDETDCHIAEGKLMQVNVVS